MRRILRWVMILSCFTGLSALAALPAAGQCSLRSDWGLYTVAPGDNLYRIALRFNTTTAALVQANCLASANRIFAGQQLRVPPQGGQPATAAPVSVPEQPSGTFLVWATYQQFEHGFMTWRADTGAIWVFFENGSRVVSYPLHVYGGLSNEARYTGVTIPPDRDLPVNGFKRVYDNFPDVRQMLGWAIGGEQGYQMALTVPIYGSGSFTMSLPDGQLRAITSDGRWGHVTGVIPPAATPTPSPTQQTTGASFQPFEHGFMVWRADNGEISVYVGGDNGELSVYPAAQYGALPTRAFQPPAGRWYPEFGFGRVWTSIPGVRERLGWALGGEQGYTMILVAFDASGRLTSFSLPDGRFLTQRSGSSWLITPGGVLVNP
jgi:murein DD-endopeptidase MepM/ murein hydrolase activator NlpD